MGGYLVVASILAIDGLLFNAYSLGTGARYSTKVLEEFFYFSFGTTMVAAILLTMRLLAEERQTGTALLLDASPLSDTQIIVCDGGSTGRLLRPRRRRLLSSNSQGCARL